MAGYRALATVATLGAAGACNYDFDEFYGLGPPLLDSGTSTEGGAAGAGRSDAAGGGSGKAGSAGGAGAHDAGKGDGAGGAGGAGGTGAAGTGSGGNAGSSGATGSGGAGGAGAAGGNAGAGGTAGSSGSGGAGAVGGTGGAAGAGGGTGGSGGSTVDASVDGAGGAGTGGTGTGGTGTGTGGTAGTGTGGTGGAGTSGAAGTGGAGTGGTGGVTPPPDGSTRPDIRLADISLDRVEPPFDCAAVGGRTYEQHCYYVKTTPVTWEVAAKEACPAPAHLVTITSDGEHTFVTSFLTDESRWIGLHRPAGSPKNPSAFQWITGETSTYTHWYTANGEPDYDGECVRLGPSNNWGDNPCSAAFPVICERE